MLLVIVKEGISLQVRIFSDTSASAAAAAVTDGVVLQLLDHDDCLTALRPNVRLRWTGA